MKLIFALILASSLFVFSNEKFKLTMNMEGYIDELIQEIDTNVVTVKKNLFDSKMKMSKFVNTNNYIYKYSNNYNIEEHFSINHLLPHINDNDFEIDSTFFRYNVYKNLEMKDLIDSLFARKELEFLYVSKYDITGLYIYKDEHNKNLPGKYLSIYFHKKPFPLLMCVRIRYDGNINYNSETNEFTKVEISPENYKFQINFLNVYDIFYEYSRLIHLYNFDKYKKFINFSIKNILKEELKNTPSASSDIINSINDSNLVSKTIYLLDNSNDYEIHYLINFYGSILMYQDYFEWFRDNNFYIKYHNSYFFEQELFYEDILEPKTKTFDYFNLSVLLNIFLIIVLTVMIYKKYKSKSQVQFFS